MANELFRELYRAPERAEEVRFRAATAADEYALEAERASRARNPFERAAHELATLGA